MTQPLSPAENPLGTAPVGSLLKKFAIPSIISMVVSALYNIVDQIFIGQGVGMLGNAATNVAFPMTTITVAISLLLGIGGAAGFNLALGRKQTEKAKRIAGTAFGLLVLLGLGFCICIRLFLEPVVLACGATGPNAWLRSCLCRNYLSWISLLYAHYRRQSFDPRRWEACLLYAHNAFRGADQHSP